MSRRLGIRAGAAASIAAFVLAAGAFSSLRADTNGISATLNVPPGEYTIGDPVTLTLTVTHPAGTEFDPPDLSPFTRPEEGTVAPPATKDRGEAEAKAPLAVETPQLQHEEPDDPRHTTWTIRVRPFRIGEIPLAALTLKVRGGAMGGTEVSTAPSALRVASVLKTPDEPAADIRGPWRLPAVWWPIAVGILLAALLAWYLWKWWKRRPARPAAAVPAPPPPPPTLVENPYDRAVRELQALLAARLRERGEIKEFHVRLSEILKTFLGGHLKFDAVDRTTAEVLSEIAGAGVPHDVLDSTSGFLEACDLVKFARHRPTAATMDETVEHARMLIELGRPAPAGHEEAAA